MTLPCPCCACKTPISRLQRSQRLALLRLALNPRRQRRGPAAGKGLHLRARDLARHFRDHTPVRDYLFDLVDPSFLAGEYTQTFAWREGRQDEVFAAVLAHGDVIASRRGARGERGVYQVEVQLEALDTLISGGTVAGVSLAGWARDRPHPEASLAAARRYLQVLRLQVSVERNGAFLYERYERQGWSRRRVCTSPASIQGCPSAFRRVICPTYWDIDMVAAHQTILASLCRQKGIPVPSALSSLLEHRELWLDAIEFHYECSGAQAKALLLALTYGAGWGNEEIVAPAIGDRDIVPFLREYQQALKPLAHDLFGIDTTSPDWRSEFACAVQDVEDEVLAECEAFHHSRREYVASLMYDGFLLRHAPDLAALSEWIHERTGLDVRFKAKSEPTGRSSHERQQPCKEAA